jgi:hypothetical protein
MYYSRDISEMNVCIFSMHHQYMRHCLLQWDMVQIWISQWIAVTCHSHRLGVNSVSTQSDMENYFIIQYFLKPLIRICIPVCRFQEDVSSHDMQSTSNRPQCLRLLAGLRSQKKMRCIWECSPYKWSHLKSHQIESLLCVWWTSSPCKCTDYTHCTDSYQSHRKWTWTSGFINNYGAWIFFTLVTNSCILYPCTINHPRL